MSPGQALRSLNLQQLGELAVDSYVLFLSQDERPPQGLAGLVDWQLAGALSAQLKSDFFKASKGDSLLLSTAELNKYHPLPGSRLFVFGLGASEGLRANSGDSSGNSEISEDFAQLASLAAEKVKRAGAKDLLIALPALIDENQSAPILKTAFAAAGFGQLTLAKAAKRSPQLPRSSPSQISQPPPVRSQQGPATSPPQSAGAASKQGAGK